MEILPSGPEPATFLISTPSSLAILLTEGAAGAEFFRKGGWSSISPGSVFFSPAEDPPTGLKERGISSSDFDGTDSFLTVLIMDSTFRITDPTFALSPGLTFISTTFPSTVEGTSIVALSVEGKVVEINVKPGDKAKVGSVILKVESIIS